MPIIYTYPTKGAPTSADLILISDASDNNATKSATETVGHLGRH